MRVRILKETEYTPSSSDHRSCWGQLQRKPGPSVNGRCGPMVNYFPVGRLPELPDDIAKSLIESGHAAAYIGEESVNKTTSEILDGLAVTE